MRIEKKKQMKEFCDLFFCAAMLHNWLIEMPEPAEWNIDAPDDHNIDGEGDAFRTMNYEGERRRNDEFSYITSVLQVPNNDYWNN